MYKSSDKTNHQALYIIYDGIANSVFSSQVIAPLIKRLENDETLLITLLSFERDEPAPNLIQEKIPGHPRLELIIKKRSFYWGKRSLYQAIRSCVKIIKETPYTEFLARGPLAGFIALQSIKILEEQLQKKSLYNRSFVQKITIQARGLCAEEYLYTARKKYHKNLFTWIASWALYWSYAMLEKEVYCANTIKKIGIPVIIESVSPALSNYLQEEFGSDKKNIKIADTDIPPILDKKQVKEYKISKRAELGISENKIVYCYSGSFKPWQCAEETIIYFSELKKRDPQLFLLILSADNSEFIKALNHYNVPRESYRVLSVPYHELYHYLAVADFGILLREKNNVNWVSRPTKLLEYEAVGLKIVHNNTVAWLVHQKSNLQEQTVLPTASITKAQEIG